MAYLTNTSGTGTSSFYRKLGVISGTEPVILEMRGRILQHEHDGSAFIGGGFSFGIGTGTTGWSMGILPTQIRKDLGAHQGDLSLIWSDQLTVTP